MLSDPEVVGAHYDIYITTYDTLRAEEAPTLTAFANPTINAFKRLGPDTLAPSRANWGSELRPKRRPKSDWNLMLNHDK